MSRIAAAVTLTLALAVPAAAVAADGQPDGGFGSGGIASPACGMRFGTPVAAQADGKSVVAGMIGDFFAGSSMCVQRLGEGGPPDTSFGAGGVVEINFSDGADVPGAIAIQPDGKIVVAGTSPGSGPGSPTLSLARVNPDGSLDATFGGDGRVNHTLPTDYTLDDVRRVLFGPAGHVYVTGSHWGYPEPWRYLAVRLTPAGDLDSGYGGGDAIASYDFKEQAEADGGALQPDGKIVLGGYARGDAAGPNDFEAVRFTADGQVDTGFGEAGAVEIGFGYAEEATSVVLEPSGSIWLAGDNRDDEGFTHVGVVRLNPDGSFDREFSKDGVDVYTLGPATGLSDATRSVDGKLVLAGWRSTTRGASSGRELIVVKLLPSGGLDPSFGTGGVGSVRTAGEIRQIALARDPGGRLYTAAALNPDAPTDDFVVARFGDSLPLVTLTGARVNEGEDVVFEARLDKVSGNPIPLDIRTAPGTATAGDDYTTGSASPTFQPGEQLVTFRVGTFADGLVEPDETFFGVASVDGPARLREAVVSATIVNAPRAGVCANVITGTVLDDDLTGSGLGDAIFGLPGADRITALAGDDCAEGDSGADRLDGGDGSDDLRGGSGNDRIWGGAGRDRLEGNAGDDVLSGGANGNVIYGGAGNDRVKAVNGKRDAIDCGSGRRDRARVDRRDRVTGCESVTRV